MDAHAMKIDIILPPLQDELLILSSQELNFALQKHGVEARLLKPNYKNPGELIDSIIANKSDYTLSFNGLLPDYKGRFLADMIKIPHIAYLLDFPIPFISLVNSPLTRIVVSDPDSLAFLQGLNGKHLFLLEPSAPLLEENREKKRKFLAWASSLTPKTWLDKLSKKYPQGVVNTLKRAAILNIENTQISFYEALARSVRPEELDPSRIDFIALLDDLEKYTHALLWDRFLEAFPEKVDVFADPFYDNELPSKFKDKHNFLETIDYSKWLNEVRTSEYSLQITPVLKKSGSNQFFAALSAGAVPIINPTPYNETWNIIPFDYAYPQFNELHDHSALAEKNRTRFKTHDLWLNRAKSLLDKL
ncbi:MAG: hypothetical protein ACK4HV_02445 [Parachlamydiaceae bacterium]